MNNKHQPNPANELRHVRAIDQKVGALLNQLTPDGVFMLCDRVYAAILQDPNLSEYLRSHILQLQNGLQQDADQFRSVLNRVSLVFPEGNPPKQIELIGAILHQVLVQRYLSAVILMNKYNIHKINVFDGPDLTIALSAIGMEREQTITGEWIIKRLNH